MQILVSTLHIGERVIIDEQKDLIGCVTAITFRMTEDMQPYAMYMVDWIHNGTNYSHTLEDWRLAKAE